MTTTHTAEQIAAIEAAQETYSARLASIQANIIGPFYAKDLHEGLAMDSAQRNALIDEMATARDAAIAAACAEHDAVVAANGGPIDILGELLGVGAAL
tara:strand:+ start:518 stop:811 length:294 start_codon:yes stop_codon:yes gene_type:complete